MDIIISRGEIMDKIDRESIVDTSLPFEVYLNQLLYLKLQFQSHQKGSRCIEYFIKKVIEEDLNIYTFGATKDIYPMIASHYGVSDKCIERQIRHSIETAWKNTIDENKKAVFPVVYENRPTNTAVIYAIYEYVKEYYPFDHVIEQENTTDGEKKVISSDLSFKKYLRQLIYSELQFDVRIKGSRYIEYFITKVIQEDLNIYTLSATKNIYPMIAKYFDIKEEMVESSIHYSIETAWKKISNENKKAVFPVVHGLRPTNIEAIYAIYEYVKEHFSLDNTDQKETTTDSKKQMVSSKLSFERYLRQLIYFKLQFDARTKGSHYIEYFITKVIQEDLNIYTLSATKSIYPMIAKHYGIKEEVVEGSIRYSIETAWREISDEDKKAIFPVMRGTRPTNTEVIYAIYEYAKGYYPFDNIVQQEIIMDGKKQVISSNLLYYYFHFTLQKYLEDVYHIQTKFGIQNMNILIDTLFRTTKCDNVDVDEIISYLNHTYGFIDETLSSIHDGCIELSDALKFLFKVCDQINVNDKEETAQVKDKVYIKKSIDKLLVQAKNIRI